MQIMQKMCPSKLCKHWVENHEWKEKVEKQAGKY